MLVLCVQAKGAKLVAVTSVKGCRLQALCDMCVHLPLERELCPFDLAPVTSTAAQMVFGDTVAIALMQVACSSFLASLDLCNQSAFLEQRSFASHVGLFAPENSQPQHAVYGGCFPRRTCCRVCMTVLMRPVWYGHRQSA